MGGFEHLQRTRLLCMRRIGGRAWCEDVLKHSNNIKIPPWSNLLSIILSLQQDQSEPPKIASGSGFSFKLK